MYHRGFNLPFLGVAALDLFISIVIIIAISFYGFGEIIDEEELQILHGYNLDESKKDD